MTEADPCTTPATRDQAFDRWREAWASGAITVHITPWHQDDLAAELLAWEPPCRT